MSVLERSPSCRLVGKEVEYIDNFWGGSFSRFVHSSIKADLKKINSNRTKNFLDKNIQTILMVGIGCLFLLFSMYINFIFVFILTVFVGGFFVIYGLLCVYLEVIQIWKNS